MQDHSEEEVENRHLDFIIILFECTVVSWAIFSLDRNVQELLVSSTDRHSASYWTIELRDCMCLFMSAGVRGLGAGEELEAGLLLWGIGDFAHSIPPCACCIPSELVGVGDEFVAGG